MAGTNTVNIQKAQFNATFKNTQYSADEKIRMLSELIDGASQGDEDVMEWYKERITIYFEEEKYQEVLQDLIILEQRGQLSEPLLMIQWISDIQLSMRRVRNSIQQNINVNLTENFDKAIRLYSSISEVKINKLLGQTSKNHPSKK